MATGDVTATASNDRAQPGLDRQRIQHVVVLMMENRSFDHLLGYLDHDDQTYPSLKRLDVSCPIDPERPDGKRIPTNDRAKTVLGADPDHSHEAVMLQMYGRHGAPRVGSARMDGFIRSYALKIAGGSIRRSSLLERVAGTVLRALTTVWNWVRRRPRPVLPRPEDIMNCFSEGESPVLSKLAKEFAVLVNWHASVPGETWPNRNFAHAATSDGTTNIEVRFYPNRTIFEQLAEVDEKKWRIYQDGIAQVWAFPQLWTSGTDNFSDFEELFSHIRKDQLPAYSFIEPNHGFGSGEGNSQHPGNNLTAGDSFVAGEVLMGRIYNALVDSPDVFSKTLFLITYDEHGGFFDHVSSRGVLPPGGRVAPSGFEFDISGVRVPAVAISALIPRGIVDHNFYDHASIPKTVRQQFAAHLDALTERDREANDLLALLPLLPAPRIDCPRITFRVPSGRCAPNP